MFARLREIWIPRLLFVFTAGCALALAAAVVVSPFLDPAEYPRWSRVIRLFSHDETVRRTAVASAIGLGVTALVFFKPGLLRRKARPQKESPPVIGA